MQSLRHFTRHATLVTLLLAAARPDVALASTALAFNTLVVVNTNSPHSVELGNYYATAHGLPSHHICEVGFDTNLVSLTSNEFRTLLLSPLTNHIAAENLGSQIDYVILCQEFPTRVRYVEGISAALFYGFKNAPSQGEAGCNLPVYTSNGYFRAERSFHSADGWNSTNGFIAFHLIASNLETAKAVAARGALAQSSFPPGNIQLYFEGDQLRGVREQRYANTQFSFTSLPGLPATCLIAPYYDLMSGKTNVLGYQDGSPAPPPLILQNNVWLPGAYADHLTSSGGMIVNLSNETSQLTVLDWMKQGLTASYGTVDEPCAYLEKFPDPLLGFWYARGFTIGEAYAMAVEAPYQGLFAGDPLAAPFAAPPIITVTSPPPSQIVTGTVPVQVSATARSNGVPAATLDLYLDGRFHTNLTTLGPTPGNILSLAVAGITNSIIIATNQSLFAAVTALAGAINSNTSQIVQATAAGDRLELTYKHFDRDGDNAAVSATTAPGTATALTVAVGPSATHLFPSVYPARKTIYVRDNPYNSGAITGDTVTCIITLTNGTAITNILVAAQGESRRSILERLMLAINNNATLQATNGVRYDRLAVTSNHVVWFGSLIARTPGPEGAGIHVAFTVNPASPPLGLMSNYNFSTNMTEFPADLRARASVLFHLQPSNGTLAATASLVTTSLVDGIHQLDFVARDGSAVAAASRLTHPLIICNSSAQLSTLGTNGIAVTNNEPASLAKGTDFAEVEWSQVQTNLYSIHNNGSAALTITNCIPNGSGAAAFQILNLPATIAAGGISNFSVAFSPPTVGVYQAALAFASDAIVPQTNILLTGTGGKRSQAINFPPIGNQVATNLLALSATADSGLPVEFSVTDGPALITDITNLTFTGSGTVSIAAAQVGNSDWKPAPDVTNSFTVFGTYLLIVDSAHGESSPPAGEHVYWHGTALAPSIASPPDSITTQFVNTGWSMMNHDPTSGSSTNFTMVLTNSTTLTWLWTTNYWLDTTAGPHGTVDVSDSWQPAGITTQITASANLFYTFANWTGSVSATSNPLGLLMDAPQSVLAIFSPILATNATPHWWLALHGWTNNFDDAALDDPDTDGYFTWQEYIADTNPTNAASFSPPLVAYGSASILAFGLDPTATGRLYHIDVSPLLVDPDWNNVTNTPGTGSAWQPEISPPGTGAYYYRSRITLAP